MKALQFDKTGDLSALRYVEVPTPLPGAGEVLVQIKAAGLNPSDVKNVLGRFPYTTLPRIPGRDFAGVVVEGPQALIGIIAAKLLIKHTKAPDDAAEPAAERTAEDKTAG